MIDTNSRLDSLRSALNRKCILCGILIPLSRKLHYFCSLDHQKEYKYLKLKDIREKRKIESSS